MLDDAGGLETKSDAMTQNYANNYEEVYQRVVDTAKRCVASSATPALTMAVEADLHKELGFGEVRFVAIGMVYSNYYVSAKIERVGSGSRISLRTAYPTIGKRVFRWAGGARECS
jgi:hypothetical protein